MRKNRYCSRSEYNKSIFIKLEKLFGRQTPTMVGECRKLSENFSSFAKSPKEETPVKLSRIKVKPLCKFLPLPPEYQSGVLKPIEPIKSREETNLHYYEEDGSSLYIPISTYKEMSKIYYSEDELLKKFKCPESHALGQVIKKLENRLQKKNRNYSEIGMTKKRKQIYFPTTSVTPTRFETNNKFKKLFASESPTVSKSVRNTKILLNTCVDRLHKHGEDSVCKMCLSNYLGIHL
ncbi:unnamed protein product [Blepharisma stoltei]|uniref:Uncharacterized protein n=1 Tax=Blepharisma stoltei TaxID=1481888 RepID=A0AAU9IL13_9CILI|nr:unnamed protein product [Blepharisma stoltei]